MKTTLILGASGATGKHLAEQLLQMRQSIKVIVRSPENIPQSWKTNEHVTIIHADVLDIEEDQMAEYVSDCQAVASCLGHNLNWKGIYGEPRKLVTDSVISLCNAIKKNKAEYNPIKFVLMNTTGNQNRDLNEVVSVSQKIVLGLIRILLPPHVDNEKAADYLRTRIGHNDQYIEWVAVRPDTLLNENEVTAYKVHPSPIRSALFNPGKTSRINVGHFMAKLITEDDIWNKWKGQMPVIYNKTHEK